MGKVIVGEKDVPCVGLYIHPEDDPVTTLMAESAINAQGSIPGPNLPRPGKSGYLVRELHPNLSVAEVRNLAQRLGNYASEVLAVKPYELSQLVQKVGTDAIRGASIDPIIKQYQEPRAS